MTVEHVVFFIVHRSLHLKQNLKAATRKFFRGLSPASAFNVGITIDRQLSVAEIAWHGCTVDKF